MGKDMSVQIEAACREQHGRLGSVLPPQVCRFCMGCPLGTLVVGVTGGSARGPDPIPDGYVPVVTAWLGKLAATHDDAGR